MKKIFFLINLNKDSKAAKTIRTNVKDLVKKVTGLNDIKKCDTDELTKVFDEAEKMELIDKTNFILLILNDYHSLWNIDKFNRNIESGMVRDTFKESRDIINLSVADTVPDGVVQNFNDEVDVVVATGDDDEFIKNFK